MKLVIVRHGDPDYANDTLTPKGQEEAEALAAFWKDRKFDHVYASPLGRALKTCETVQKACGFSYEVLPWLREFNAHIRLPYLEKPSFCWDILPDYMAKHPLLFDPVHWMEDETFRTSEDIHEKWERVRQGLEELLARHGYVRDGYLFRAEKSNRDMVVLFCHYGITSVIMSMLTGASPYVFWQHFCSLTTSVTTLATEEREEGKVIFRCNGFGDLSHLAVVGREPSFAARFCETFDSDERHH